MIRKTPILIVLVLYLVWPLYQVLDYIGVQPFANAVDMANYGASILAYDWLLLNVLLSLKIPLLQRALPYDFRIRAHIVTTIGITAFLGWHALYYLVLNPKEISLVTWSLVVVFPLLIFFSLRWISLPGFRWLAKGSYDVLKLVHKVLYVVLAALAYVHVIDAKVIGVASPASSFGFQLLFVAAVGAFVLARVHNLLLPMMTVEEVTTRGGVTEVTLVGNRKPRYRAGQFAFLRFQHPELGREEHPFSFTSAAHEPAVTFAIKNVGDFTAKLPNLAVGDRVKVNGGFGAFRPPRTNVPLVLIGTGIGAAPLVSILKELVEHPRTEPLHCIVSANSRDDLVDPDWWDRLPGLLPGLKLRVLLADQGAPLFSEQLMRDELGDPTAYEYFLCSSDRVRKILLGILIKLRVPSNKIHYEGFTFG
jgi:predicted ferric reductase